MHRQSSRRSKPTRGSPSEIPPPVLQAVSLDLEEPPGRVGFDPEPEGPVPTTVVERATPQPPPPPEAPVLPQAVDPSGHIRSPILTK